MINSIKITQILFSKVMKKLFNIINNGVFKFCKKYLLGIIVLGFFGIFAAVTGHYGLMGFDPFAFFFFELPLYCILIYAMYKVFGSYFKSHKDECDSIMDIFIVNEDNKDDSCPYCDKN